MPFLPPVLEGVGRDSCSNRSRGWTATAVDLTDKKGIKTAKIWEFNKRRSFTKKPFFLVFYTIALVGDIIGILLFSGKADDKSCVITLALIRKEHTLQEQPQKL